MLLQMGLMLTIRSFCSSVEQKQSQRTSEHDIRQGHPEIMIKWGKSQVTIQSTKHPPIKYVTVTSLPMIALLSL